MKQLLFSLVCCWSLWPTGVSADLIITVQNASIIADQIGFVDVLIESTGTDDLAFASFEVKITGSIDNGTLRFLPTQTNYDHGFAGPPAYLFGSDVASGNWSGSSPDMPDYFRMIGSDFTQSAANVSVSTTQRLLRRLSVKHNTGTPLDAVNDTFKIQLINNDNGTPGLLDDSTQFWDEDFFTVLDPDLATPVLVTAGSFTSFGTVTVLSNAAAVPEPATLGLIAVGMAALACVRRRSGLATEACRAEMKADRSS